MTIILFWAFTSYKSVQKAKNREGIILSPDKSKSVEIINSLGTTQVLMNFHKRFIGGGSNVFSGDIDINEIFLKWTDDNHLIVTVPSNSVIRNRENTIKFFGEIVHVEYHESH
ncbi:MAG: hypothetical protein ABJB16_03725 [Saprospiraceae bacterium]